MSLFMVFMSLRERFLGFGLAVQFLVVLEREFCAHGFSWFLLNILDFVRYFYGLQMFSMDWLV